jgi:hypothetical protein
VAGGDEKNDASTLPCVLRTHNDLHVRHGHRAACLTDPIKHLRPCAPMRLTRVRPVHATA